MIEHFRSLVEQSYRLRLDLHFSPTTVMQTDNKVGLQARINYNKGTDFISHLQATPNFFEFALRTFLL